ncbi:hypothetical protein L1080_032830 [Rhodococcus sp. MSC1_016]|jgi:hypothetical protein|nr:hypothetical protein [Rhodococcus wratislaviensis]GLK33367.1 hypothetical protein GCM10017611_02090 [Rhodococcus wratislaviensis]
MVFGDDTTEHLPDIADAVRSYRAARHRRLKERRVGVRSQPSEELEILRFAEIWAPFGGPPPDEIFQRFGMKKDRFTQRLWESVEKLRCGPAVRDQLALVYSIEKT